MSTYTNEFTYIKFREHGHLHLLIKENHLKKSDARNIINDWYVFI